MKIGKGLKTTANARRPVSGKPASVKVPGLPGLKGAHEASGIPKGRGVRVKGGSINGKKGMKGAESSCG